MRDHFEDNPYQAPQSGGEEESLRRKIKAWSACLTLAGFSMSFASYIFYQLVQLKNENALKILRILESTEEDARTAALMSYVISMVAMLVYFTVRKEK